VSTFRDGPPQQSYFEPGKVGLWRQRIAGWVSSGLSSADYAAKEGLVEYQLLWWRWILEGKTGPSPARTLGNTSAPPKSPQIPSIPSELEPIPDPVIPGGSRVRLTADELELVRDIQAELERRKKSEHRWCPQRPTGKQKDFLASKELEVLYGGAAGGGKSSAMLMAALQYVDVPGYNALILRRSYKDLALPGAVMDRSHEFLASTDAHWDKQEKRWTFPSGATLSFGFIDNDRDRFRYASAEFAFIGFDELTQFPESWYRFMFSRLRKPHALDVPLRVRSASNPGGIGHRWVRKRFLAEKDKNRRFIPARLDDNPHVDTTSYELSLAQLDPVTRAQLRNGDWTIVEGGLVLPYDERKVVIADAPKCAFHILAADFGFTDACAFVVLGWRPHDPRVYVLEVYKQIGLTPSKAAEFIKSLDKTYSFDAMVGDFGGLGKGYAEEAKERFDLPIKAAEKQNKRGYFSLLAGDLNRARVQIVRDRCVDLLKEMDELPWNEDRSLPEEGFEDHCVDGLLYGWREARAFLEGPVVEGLKKGSVEWFEDDEGYQRVLEERIERADNADYEPVTERDAYYGLESGIDEAAAGGLVQHYRQARRR